MGFADQPAANRAAGGLLLQSGRLARERRLPPFREEAVDDAVLLALTAPIEGYSQLARRRGPDFASGRSRRAVDWHSRIAGRTCSSHLSFGDPAAAAIGTSGPGRIRRTALWVSHCCQWQVGLPVANPTMPRPSSTLTPERSAALRGRISDKIGKPIAHARVQLVLMSDQVCRDVRSDKRVGRVLRKMTSWRSANGR